MTAPDDRGRDGWGEAPQLRSLRLLITILTATLIIGIGAIFAVLTWRIMSEPPASTLARVTAERVAIPEGAEIVAVGATAEALTVAIRDGKGEALLIFDGATGERLRRVRLERGSE